MKSILIIEDDNDINKLLCDLLESNLIAVKTAFSGTEGLIYFENSKFDLVLLDLMLPGKNGLEVLTEIRSKSRIPVIMLTAVNDKLRIVELLKHGANDYITKPFDNAELLARIEVQLRSTLVDNKSGIIEFKGIKLDELNFKAELNNEDLQLSKIEFDILNLLLHNPKRVFTKNNLYESVWHGDYLGDDNTINVHISKIRSKLAKIDPKNEYIKTVWGIGFKMAE